MKKVLKPLDKNTYGNTPALEYLVALLNEHIEKKSEGIQSTVREIGTHLSSFQTMMKELNQAAEEGLLSYRSLSMLCTNLWANIDQWMPNVRVDDIRIYNLTRNSLAGVIKETKRRLTEVQKLRSKQNSMQSVFDRKRIKLDICTPDGIPLFVDGKKTPVNIGDVYVDREAFVDRLRQRNQVRMKRLGK